MIPIRTKHIRLRLDPGSYETLLQLNDSELNLITLCGSTMPTKAPVVTARPWSRENFGAKRRHSTDRDDACS